MAMFAATSTTPLLTLEERVQRIEALAGRINGYVKFMCQVASLDGMSGEAKERAVTVFHEYMITVENQLGRIYEHFRLE
jgi:hypothetical protein